MTEEVKELACLFTYISRIADAFEEASPAVVLEALSLFKKHRSTLCTARWIEGNGVEYVMGGGYEKEVHDSLTSDAVPQRIKEEISRQLKEWRSKQGQWKPESECALRTGAIYLATANGHGYTKIGFSSVPKVRESTLQAEEPSFRLIFKSAPKFTIRDEQSLHRRYAAKRKRGEWFLLSQGDINSIKKELA
jgi:hypothetical protein